MRNALKNFAQNIPHPVGRVLSRVPFSARLGKEYSRFSELLSTEVIGEEYVVRNFSKIFEYAKKSVPFYRHVYSEAGILDHKIESLSDIDRVPIITKADLRDCADSFSGAMKLNTGGSSGVPFEFFVDKNAFAREWAHMHFIWRLRGYNYRDYKLTFRGKNLGSRAVRYNPVHNEFVVNTYLPVETSLSEVVSLVRKHKIRFMHGYPSAVYNYFKYAEDVASDAELEVLKENLSVSLLGSEFPVPYMVDYLRDVWGFDFISWYGHSEMCVLAYDKLNANRYSPLQSYGYAESFESRLIGTSYHNFDMPLIRYDTADLIEPFYDEVGLLKEFSIKEGREGDFVEDRAGKRVPLTALIFGRHHEIFGVSDSIQVRQVSRGEVELLISTKNSLTEDDALMLFDLSGVDIDFAAKLITKPILTKAGKMPLKVN